MASTRRTVAPQTTMLLRRRPRKPRVTRTLEKAGRRPRGAAGQDEDVVEDPQHVCDAEEEDHEEERPEVRQLDAREEGPPRSPVDLRRVDRLGRHRLEPREEDEVDERGPLPDGDA